MARGAPFAAVVERWAYMLGAEAAASARSSKSRRGPSEWGARRTDYSKPVHPVTFAQPFSLGATEVTFREWDACVADGGCDYRPADQGWGREMRPVINVSWQDAQTYVAWLSRRTGKTCRLPSEAEWEYAARAGTTTEYALPAPDGSDDIKGKALANCADCGSQWDWKQTAPVGQFPANAWGLHDMHGNVLEWVEDCWHDNYKERPTTDARGARRTAAIVPSVCCAAGPGTTTRTTRARPTATGTARTTGTTTSVFVWCVRPPSSGTDH